MAAKVLEFDERLHRYTFGGVHVPNVTRVLESTLDSFANVPAQVLEVARLRGRAVHRATELHDRDDLDYETVDTAIVDYLEAWVRFREETGFAPSIIEEKVFHPRHWYAGTLDRIGTLFGEEVLLDIKSGILVPSAGPQTAAYLEAWNHRRGHKIRRRYVVQLKDDMTYRLHEMTEQADFTVFLASLTLNNWRLKHDR